jgi:hypothetical protein
MPNENMLSRRGLLMKLGILFNGLVAAALAVPILWTRRAGYGESKATSSRCSP